MKGLISWIYSSCDNCYHLAVTQQKPNLSFPWYEDSDMKDIMDCEKDRKGYSDLRHQWKIKVVVFVHHGWRHEIRVWRIKRRDWGWNKGNLVEKLIILEKRQSTSGKISMIFLWNYGKLLICNFEGRLHWMWNQWFFMNQRKQR